MENKNNELEILPNKENIHRIKIGDMCVNMAYSSNNKSFAECMLNILKQKMGK